MDDPNVVSPGILGFIAFFALAVALYFLVRNMNGHLRRMGYRAAELEKEQAAAAEAAEPPDEAADAAQPPAPPEEPPGPPDKT